MPLTPQQYAANGIQDLHDVLDRAPDSPWPDDHVWDLDGKKVTEAEFNKAWEHFEKTGERPDWWG